MGVMTNDRKRSPYPVKKETIIRKMESGREEPRRGVPERGSRAPTHTLSGTQVRHKKDFLDGEGDNNEGGIETPFSSLSLLATSFMNER